MYSITSFNIEREKNAKSSDFKCTFGVFIRSILRYLFFFINFYNANKKNVNINFSQLKLKLKYKISISIN